MVYGDFNDLARRTTSDKVLRNKAFNIAKNRKYDGYQRSLDSMVYKFFDKKSSAASTNKFAGSSIAMLQNEQLAEELHKVFIKKF